MNKEKKKIDKKIIGIIILVLALVLLDQLSKIIVGPKLAEGNLDIIPGVLAFSYVENTGGAFGVGQNSTFTFIVTNIIVLGIILKFMLSQNSVIEMRVRIALSLVLAGGISNLMDRIFRGFVLDFIDCSMLFPFPKFNIADICIVMGWILLAGFFAHYTIKEIRLSKTKKEEKQEKSKEE